MGCCLEKPKNTDGDEENQNGGNGGKDGTKKDPLIDGKADPNKSPSGKKRKKNKGAQPTEALMFNHPSKYTPHTHSLIILKILGTAFKLLSSKMNVASTLVIS